MSFTDNIWLLSLGQLASGDFCLTAIGIFFNNLLQEDFSGSAITKGQKGHSLLEHGAAHLITFGELFDRLFIGSYGFPVTLFRIIALSQPELRIVGQIGFWIFLQIALEFIPGCIVLATAK